MTPSLVAKSLHPHSMRRSTAVHLLRAGFDIFTISRGEAEDRQIEG